MLDLTIFGNLTSCHKLVTQLMTVKYAEWTVNCVHVKKYITMKCTEHYNSLLNQITSSFLNFTS
jgi:hypothetical protein